MYSTLYAGVNYGVDNAAFISGIWSHVGYNTSSFTFKGIA
jgi:hypothetical protein